MERKILLAVTLSGLVILASTQLWLNKFAYANPYNPHVYYSREVSPQAYAKVFIIFPPENHTLVNSKNLTISLKANITGATISDIYYKPSWLSTNITVMPDENNIFLFSGVNFNTHEYSGNLFFTEMPEGNQSVTITVKASSSYTETVPIPQVYPWDPSTGIACYYWHSYVSYVLGFTVDTVPPQVSVLDLDNKSFPLFEVPLSYVVNEAISKVTYSLNGEENVTINGNTTLTGLKIGEYTLKIFATDEAGNTGSSETLFFTVEEPFPTLLVATASIIIIVVVFAVFLLMRKHKQ